MLHKDVTEISFTHRFDIFSVIKNILKNDLVQHFSLNLVRPDGEMLFFSGTPSHAFEICNKGFGDFDGIISPENYQNKEFYWWKDAGHKAYQDEIQYIRRCMLNLHDGFMLVRNFDDFYFMYSYAFKKHIEGVDILVEKELNTFLQMGDTAYMKLRDIYRGYCGNYFPPKIKQFYPFEGGAPRQRKTNNPSDNNIILFDTNK